MIDRAIEKILKQIHEIGEEYYSVDHSTGAVSFYEYLARRLYDAGYRLSPEPQDQIDKLEEMLTYWRDTIQRGASATNPKEMAEAIREALRLPVEDGKLREEVAKRLYKAFPYDTLSWEQIVEEAKKCYYNLADQLISLIRQATLSKVYKWSETLCPHSWGKYPNLGSRKGCQRCWEVLKAHYGQEG